MRRIRSSMDVSPTGPLVRSSTERDHFRSSLIASSTTKYLSCRSWGLMSDSLRGLTSGDLLMPLGPQAPGQAGRGSRAERGISVRHKALGELGAAGAGASLAGAAEPGCPSPPPARPPSQASRPVSPLPRLRWAPRAMQIGASGERRRLKLHEQLTLPSWTPDRPVSVAAGPRRPLSSPLPGRYSHGDALAPGRAAGKLSDPHRQRLNGAGSAQT